MKCFRWFLLAPFLWGGDLFAAKVYESEGQKFEVQVLAERDSVVWGFDFLSPERIVFTERDGKIGILDLKSNAVTEVAGAPKVWNHGQGGMLDIRVHPKSHNRIYFTYSDPMGEDEATTTLATATLEGSALTGMKKLLSAVDPNDNDIHFGSRVEFDGKGHVFFAVGDRGERERAQQLQFHQGKLMRLNEDGSVPKDNPFIGKAGAKPEIWSYGHRSPQGLAFHPKTGELWAAEMGPRGGDEINVIKPGANYGWPIATYGREYHGPKIADGTAPGVTPPIVYWVPSISPSAMNFYTGKVFPKWNGNIFLCNLSSTHLRRLVLNGQKVVKQEELLKNTGRFRNVRSGPDGFLYYSTDDGKIARLVAVK